MLKKKTVSVSNCFVCESIIADDWRTTCINKENLSDVLTKNLPVGNNGYKNIHMILYDIYPIENDVSGKTNI